MLGEVQHRICRVRAPDKQLVVVTAAGQRPVVRAPGEAAHLPKYRGQSNQQLHDNHALVRPADSLPSTSHEAHDQVEHVGHIKPRSNACHASASAKIDVEHGPPLTFVTSAPMRTTYFAGFRNLWPTSDRCACWRLATSSPVRMSRCRMDRSRLPVDSRWLLHAIVLTLPLWPASVRTLQGAGIGVVAASVTMLITMTCVGFARNLLPSKCHGVTCLPRCTT